MCGETICSAVTVILTGVLLTIPVVAEEAQQPGKQGFVARTPDLLAGALNQNPITIGGDNSRRNVMLSSLQPIFSHSLGDGRSVGTSDMTAVYDRDTSELSSLLRDVKVSKLTRDLGLPLQIQLAYERNFADDGVGPQDTVSLVFKYWCRNEMSARFRHRHPRNRAERCRS